MPGCGPEALIEPIVQPALELARRGEPEDRLDPFPVTRAMPDGRGMKIYPNFRVDSAER
jgi:hypothetical protein